MSDLDLLPARFRMLSISADEIVLPVAEALEAIDHLEANGVRVLGWEGWVKDPNGRVGHGSAPQGTANLDQMSVHDAAASCRHTIRLAAEQWLRENLGTTDVLHVCITVQE